MFRLWDAERRRHGGEAGVRPERTDDFGSAEKGVVVEPANECPSLQARTRFHEGPKEVLPSRHPVGEIVEPRLTLRLYEEVQIRLEPGVHRLRCDSAALQTARGRHHVLRSREDPVLVRDDPIDHRAAPAAPGSQARLPPSGPYFAASRGTSKAASPV